MSEPAKTAPTVPKWVRYFVDYAGLVVFLITLVATKSAVTASWAIVGGSVLALAVGLVMERRIAPMPLVTAVLGLIFGGLTLFFHDERFIKVKPTILYGAFGLFLITGALRGKNPLKVLMGDAFHLPDPVVRTLTLRYALFFLASGIINIVVWQTLSEGIWVLYKVGGQLVLLLAFSASQVPFLMKHMQDPPEPPLPDPEI